MARSGAIDTKTHVQPQPRSGIASSFGTASFVVVVGVLATWVALKRDGDVMELPMPEVAAVVATDAGVQLSIEGQSLLEQAELAFAAGRIVEPEFDNALSYYLAMLKAEPGNAAAMAGIDRVMSYLESEAEGAIFRNDWDAARAYADMILDVRKSDVRAKDIRARASRLERIESLSATALEQFAAGRLVTPANDNAAQTYKEILGLDRTNEFARQGLRSVVQRLVASAQSAAFAGDSARAQRYVSQVKALDPKAPGLAEVEQSNKQMRRMADDQSVQADLLAASEALQDDRLMPPAKPNAYDLFNAVLRRQPSSDAAQRGLQLVRDALVERVRSQLAAGSAEGAAEMLTQARLAGVDGGVVDALDADVQYLARIADARAGVFDRIYTLKDLTILRQVAPTYPRTAAARGLEGWVEVEFTVDERGDVRDAIVRDSSESAFESAAIAAVKRWRFEPTIEGERAVPVRAFARFNFQDG